MNTVIRPDKLLEVTVKDGKNAYEWAKNADKADIVKRIKLYFAKSAKSQQTGKLYIEDVMIYALLKSATDTVLSDDEIGSVENQLECYFAIILGSTRYSRLVNSKWYQDKLKENEKFLAKQNYFLTK